MKILVTGASGFVGSHLVPALIHKGHVVTGLWNQNKPPFQIPLRQGDLTDFEFVDQAVKGHDAVIHLAANMRIKPHQDRSFLQEALKSADNLVKACEKHSVQKILFTSSTVALGATQRGQPLITETFKTESPQWDKFINVKAKREVEKIILSSTLDSTIIYSGLLYGAGDWNKSIRKSNKALLKGRMPFYFSGGVNVNQIENFIEGLILAFEKNGNRKKFILGGENISNQIFFSLLAQSAGQTKPKYRFPSFILRSIAKLNTGSVLNIESIETLLAYHWCDSSSAIRELGYKPGSAQIAIQKSTDWIVSHGNL